MSNKIPKHYQERLEGALEKLEALITADSTCGVEKEHKEAVSLYVRSWIRQPLLEIQDYLNDKRNGYGNLTPKWYEENNGK